MATINVSWAFRTKNNVLRKLLHKGSPTGLRIWGPTSSAIGGIEELVTLSTGWNHKQSKDAKSGALIETVKINEAASVTDALLLKAEGADILYPDDTFERFTFAAKSQMQVIGHEWTFTVTPSKGDKRALYAVLAYNDNDQPLLNSNDKNILVVV